MLLTCALRPHRFPKQNVIVANTSTCESSKCSSRFGLMFSSVSKELLNDSSTGTCQNICQPACMRIPSALVTFGMCMKRMVLDRATARVASPHQQMWSRSRARPRKHLIRNIQKIAFILIVCFSRELAPCASRP